MVAGAAPPSAPSQAACSSPRRTALLQARPRLLLPVQSLVCLAAFGLALPLAISLFPQMSEVSEGRGSRAGRAGVVSCNGLGAGVPTMNETDISELRVKH